MTTHHWNQMVAGDCSGAEREPAELPADLTIERVVQRKEQGIRRPLAALFSPILDRKLAAGCPPESGGLLAARAERLVSASKRRGLVQGWERVLNEALRAARPRNPHVPLCRRRIIGAIGDVRTMLRALSTPLPVSARGVAMAGRLLGDGTGPLYNGSCAVHLSTALREVTAQLDPGFSKER
jgi:hypothetical protein